MPARLKLSDEMLATIKRAVFEGTTHRAIEKQYGVSRSTAQRIAAATWVGSLKTVHHADPVVPTALIVLRDPLPSFDPITWGAIAGHCSSLSDGLPT